MKATPVGVAKHHTRRPPHPHQPRRNEGHARRRGEGDTSYDWLIPDFLAAMKATPVGVAKVPPPTVRNTQSDLAAMKATPVGVASRRPCSRGHFQHDRPNEGHARRRGEGVRETRERDREPEAAMKATPVGVAKTQWARSTACRA